MRRSRNPWSTERNCYCYCYCNCDCFDWKAQVSTDTMVSHTTSIYTCMIQLRRRRAKRKASEAAAATQLLRGVKTRQNCPRKKTISLQKAAAQNEFNYTSKRCTSWTDTQIRRYIDTRAKDTDTSAGLAVAWLKRVGGGEELEGRSTRVFWCLQARNWIKLKTKRNWNHTHTQIP